MTLFSSELRLRRAGLAAWTLGVALLVLVVVVVYPSIRGQDSLDSIYADLSPSMQRLLGGSDLTSPVGYLNTQLFAFFVPMVVLVHGISRGAAALAGEEQARTLDLLLAQPIRRDSAYLQKAAAVAAGVGLITVATALPLVALDSVAELNLPVADLIAASVQLGLFTLALSAAAQAIGAATGVRVAGIGTTAGYAAVSYLVYGLAGSVPVFAHLRPLSLWRWYLGNDPVRTGFGSAEVAVLLVSTGVFLGLGAFAFNRRDLRC